MVVGGVEDTGFREAEARAREAREAAESRVLDLPGCVPTGVLREGGRFADMDAPACEARVADLIESSQKLVGRINADQAALAANTTELLGLFQVSGWGWGWRSPAHRLACQLKMTGVEARQLVTAADRLGDLPELSAAFTHGEVGLRVAAAVAEIATPETEATLVDQTRCATADAVLEMVNTYKRIERQLAAEAAAKNDDGEDEADPGPTDALRITTRADGYEVAWFLNATNGAVVKQMIRQRRSELFEQSGTAATSAEAMLSLLEIGPKPPSERFLVVLAIDIDVFRVWQHHRANPAGGCTGPTDGAVCTGVSIQGGPPVTEAELDAMHDQLSGRWMVSRDGHPLWISTKQRTAPAWMRTAMNFEQQCCGADGCGRAGVLEAHHSVPFTTKPETLYDEQAYFCPFHHRALHAAGATVEFNADRSGIIIRDAAGRVVSLTGVPVPPDQSPKDRPEWVGRGVWAGGMEYYDHQALEITIDYLFSNTEPWRSQNAPPGPGDPPDESFETFADTGFTGHGPPPAGGSHPASPNHTGGDTGGNSPPNS